MKSEIRFCKDIGMNAIDRSRELSCVWKTEYCDKWCFNNPIEVRFHKTIPKKDQRNDEFWSWLDGDKLNKILSRKRKPVDRLRLCTRGEPLATADDVFKVLDFAIKNREVDFWVPTRAWRNELMSAMIHSELWDIDNIFLLASIDPSNSEDEVQALKKAGWSTMYFGKDEVEEGSFKCPKTYRKIEGHCSICKGGCFNKKKRVDVHLKYHGVKRK